MARSRAADVYGGAVVPLPTAAEAAAADAAAHALGVPGRVLMESAGRAAAMVLHARFGTCRVIVLAGSGNNGGDGCVLARALHEWGCDVALVHAGRRPPEELLHGVELRSVAPEDSARELARADVVVDALLGTGASGAPRRTHAELIEAANASGRPVLSLDLPSGVDATTGAVHAPAIAASITVCFGWPKLGLLLQPARQQCGRLIAVEIGFPLDVSRDFGAAAITPDWAAARLPRRGAAAHKGTSGRVLLVAGSDGMGGAAIITARAAIAAGAGLVRVAAAESNRSALHAAVPEAIHVAPDALLAGDVARDSHALAAGPGLGTDAGAREQLDAALRASAECPVVLDADALNLFARTPDALAELGCTRPLVLTPHPAELARLLDADVPRITDDPCAAARDASDRFHCVVLLKGQPSLVAGPGEPLLVGTTGSSDVATAGMGDQLTGVVAAFLAAGADPRTAAALALFYSGRAADLAGHGRSLTPTVTSRYLRKAFRAPGADSPPDGLPFVRFDQPPRW